MRADGCRGGRMTAKTKATIALAISCLTVLVTVLAYLDKIVYFARYALSYLRLPM